MVIRDAEDKDLDGLSAFEARSFASDRIARRSFRRLINAGSARLRVAMGQELQGYHLVLFRKGSSVARLYSIAVGREHRGAGLGRRLLADAERIAVNGGKGALRLEVREDNQPAIRLYERRGYRLIGRYTRYYADRADALRYEKSFARHAKRRKRTRSAARRSV